ncbi:MAG: HlyD family efflux transporter periplasmic adaptor subunit [Bacteroidaceae bacterium]|nr:HlyD family efflux transporter periplasmic adaptor subunit [Bacteroidaceae bacterium]
MDRKISNKERQEKLRKKLLQAAAVIIVAAVAAFAAINAMRTSIEANLLKISTAHRGTISVTVTASGAMVPSIEEIINSPISSRILEVYRREGDSVDIGTPLLKLDLQQVETQYRKMLDEEKMKRYQLEQLKANNATSLSNLEMNIEISSMEVSRMQVELRNERYLDSIGSGTTDKVRQAELAYNTGVLRLKQLRHQYNNEKMVREADLKVKQLELDIFHKSLEESRITLQQAQLLSPRKGVLTYINTQVGAQVSSGMQVATVSDLSHYRVDGYITDYYSDRVAIGQKATIIVGKDTLHGTMSALTPQSKDGAMAFSIQLVEDNHPRLRSGVKGDVYIDISSKEDVVLIDNGTYYIGDGEYEMFVLTNDDTLEKRKVRLGAGNYEYVEVINGLAPGDRVVVSDMSAYMRHDNIQVE